MGYENTQQVQQTTTLSLFCAYYYTDMTYYAVRRTDTVSPTATANALQYWKKW